MEARRTRKRGLLPTDTFDQQQFWNSVCRLYDSVSKHDEQIAKTERNIAELVAEGQRMDQRLDRLTSIVAKLAVNVVEHQGRLDQMEGATVASGFVPILRQSQVRERSCNSGF